MVDENRIFLLKLGGTDQTRHAMIRELHLGPVDHRIVHVDFQRILMEQKVRVKVHFKLEGVPYGVKTDGGILDFVTREIEVECLPAEIPHEVPVDVTELRVGEHLEAGAVRLPERVTYLGSPDVVIASVCLLACAVGVQADRIIIAKLERDEARGWLHSGMTRDEYEAVQ